MSSANISGDLIWEVVRNQNAFLVKSKANGGSQFSRDPYNLTNKHTRKHAGFVNDKAVSIQANGERGVTLQTKTSSKVNKPSSSAGSHSYKSGTSNRKIYKNIADAVGKSSYRGDLNKDAVARASAIRESQKPKKDAPAPKLRGAAAKSSST